MLRPIRTLAVAAAALALVSACNSASTNGNAKGGAGDTPGSRRGLTADSVKVGGIVSMTSASGYSKKDTDLGAKARYLRANAEGASTAARSTTSARRTTARTPRRTWRPPANSSSRTRSSRSPR